MKKYIFNLKLLFSIIILYYVFQYSDFNLMELKNFNYYLLVPIIFISSLVTLTNSLRLQQLFKIHGLNLPLRDIFSLNMISGFFDLSLPSSNGGDLIKLGYIIKNKKISKMGASISIIFDRLFGFTALFIIILTLCFVINITEYPLIVFFHKLIIILLFIFFITLLFLGSRRINSYVNKFNILHTLRIISLMNSLKIISRNIKSLSQIIFYSFLSQSINLCTLLLIIFYYNEFNFSLLKFILASSIGLIGGIFGFAGGIGAGTLAFEISYNNILSINNALGITIIYQISQTIYRVIGVLFYLKYKN